MKIKVPSSVNPKTVGGLLLLVGIPLVGVGLAEKTALTRKIKNGQFSQITKADFGL